MRTLLLGALALAAPLAAQPAPAPAPAVAPLDPARLAAARTVMAKLFPDGTYRKLMGGALSQMTEGMMRQMLNLPIGQFAAMSGLPKEQLDKLGSTTSREIMAIVDPAFEQRMSKFTTIMFEQLAETMARYEPDIREGYAEAYAVRLSAAELGDLDRFLQTPSGRAYAANAIPAFMDPAVMKRMQTITPAIIQAMPVIMQKVQAATADLPKPKKPGDLSDADRAKLARLLGVDPAKLKPAQTSAQTKEPTS